MPTICIIPARGGSKRIPRKNIRAFLGTPIIAYSIRAAQESGLFDEVMVSTDDAEIAQMAQFYGASVPFVRSADAATDHATTAAVLTEVLTTYAHHGHTFDRACCLYATAPLVTTERLREAFGKLETGGFDTVFPVVRYGFPVQRAVTFQQDRLTWLQPEHALTRSQDLQPVFHDAGQFYFFNVPRFLENGQLITANTGGVELSELEAQDIDTPADWDLAELKYRLLWQQRTSK
ncbi:pseudaminic acid cytidylyltransferase [Fibrella sp. HMF5335]|uniref:Pseudaminic acid cytidylyltransferase n=1 Tax=Fibrella rubiginis TaxID=2817060 RepID=A0A939GMY8_9BACT|nr:pseudaminic acid cytidylyltransferase [Fibrella rubiginis]MBO0939407.1 pseudaminic acid cytidylyltransferase [Fibrella rubiginis]